MSVLRGDRRRRAAGNGFPILDGACARSVEFGYRAVGAHEAVMHAVRARLESRNIPHCIEADGDGSVKWAQDRTRALSIEGGEAGDGVASRHRSLAISAAKDQHGGKLKRRQLYKG